MRKEPTSVQRVFGEIARAGEDPLRALGHAVGLRPSTLEPKVRAPQCKGLAKFQDVGASHLLYSRVDFPGEIFTDDAERIRPEGGPQKMIAQMKEKIRELISQGEQSRGRLRGLPVGVLSPVLEGGLVTLGNNLPGWRNINLGDELKRVPRADFHGERCQHGGDRRALAGHREECG